MFVFLKPGFTKLRGPVPPGTGGTEIFGKLVFPMPPIFFTKILPIIDWPKASKIGGFEDKGNYFLGPPGNLFPPGGGNGISGKLVFTMAQKNPTTILALIYWPRALKGPPISPTRHLKNPQNPHFLLFLELWENHHKSTRAIFRKFLFGEFSGPKASVFILFFPPPSRPLKFVRESCVVYKICCERFMEEGRGVSDE